MRIFSYRKVRKRLCLLIFPPTSWRKFLPFGQEFHRNPCFCRGFYTLFILFAIFAGTAKFLFSGDKATPQTAITWPSTYEGQKIKELPLSAKEQLFLRDFPGEIKRFSDGKREIIIRQVVSPTRKLHPANDCFKGVGYDITPKPVKVNEQGIKMGCFIAENKAQKMHVCEYVRDNHGNHWSDISTWYWHGIFNPSSGPWWSYVTAENI